jgi:hypothetical protein
MNNEEQNNAPIEELEELSEVNNSVKYEQQANELINSVTMADLVDPTVVQEKKKKKGLIVALVVIVLVLGVGSVLLLQNGTYSKILGITTTNELDVFKTDVVSTTEADNDNEYGKFETVGNTYVFDISTAGNGVRIKYYIKSNLVAYIQFADDFETTKNFTFNINNADYYIEDTNPGVLSLTVEPDYIAFLNSNNPTDQVILSKRGIKLEEDPSVDPEKISTTTATTTSTTMKTITKVFNFQNTTDVNGRTTYVYTEYSEEDNEWIDFIWEDEDGVVHVENYGSPLSREVHPELYTTTTKAN